MGRVAQARLLVLATTEAGVQKMPVRAAATSMYLSEAESPPLPLKL